MRSFRKTPGRNRPTGKKPELWQTGERRQRAPRFGSVRSHHTATTSYFVHLLRQQFVEMAHTRPHGPGHFALVFFLLLDQKVIGALLPLLPAPRVEARIHPAAGSQSASEQKGLFLSLHTQQPAGFGLAGL